MVLAFLSLLHLSYTSTPAATTSPLSNLCNYNAGVQWTRLPLGVHVTPCSAAAPIDPYQQWEGDTLTSLDKGWGGRGVRRTPSMFSWSGPVRLQATSFMLTCSHSDDSPIPEGTWRTFVLCDLNL